jgi:hypothetical protein
MQACKWLHQLLLLSGDDGVLVFDSSDNAKKHRANLADLPNPGKSQTPRLPAKTETETEPMVRRSRHRKVFSAFSIFELRPSDLLQAWQIPLLIFCEDTPVRPAIERLDSLVSSQWTSLASPRRVRAACRFLSSEVSLSHRTAFYIQESCCVDPIKRREAARKSSSGLLPKDL